MKKKEFKPFSFRTEGKTYQIAKPCFQIPLSDHDTAGISGIIETKNMESLSKDLQQKICAYLVVKKSGVIIDKSAADKAAEISANAREEAKKLAQEKAAEETKKADEISGLKGKISDLESQVSEKDAQIAALENENKSLGGKLAEKPAEKSDEKSQEPKKGDK